MKIKQRHGKIGAITFCLAVVMTGCGIPGMPDVVLSLPESESQKTCKQFAQAWFGTTRDQIINDLEMALATARNAPADDKNAQPIARAIDTVLTQTVVGTRESLEVASNGVIVLCRRVDVNIEWE